VDKNQLKLYHKHKDEKNEHMIKLAVSKGADWGRLVRDNRIQFIDAAEKCKAELSKPEKEFTEAFLPLTFVKDENEIEKFDTIFKVERHEFEERIQDKISEFVKKMKRMTDITGKAFDIILLSGMSSKIPLIQQLFYEEFNDIVRRADKLKELKECVVLGSLEYYDKSYNPGYIQLKFKRGKKLSGAYGMKVTTADGQNKFHELFPLGTTVPTQPKIIDIPLKRRMILTIYQNLGTGEYFDEAPKEFNEIRKFNVTIPDEIADEQISECELSLEISEELLPKLSLSHKDLDFFREFFE
jgi:hypothetical protein